MLDLPEKLIEISVLHVLKDHDERVSIHTHSIELHYVLVLKVSEELSLTLEILSGCKCGILQRLGDSESILLSYNGITAQMLHSDSSDSYGNSPPSCVYP